jgi:LmbE family N-acetylglucosaminyl deacetylase
MPNKIGPKTNLKIKLQLAPPVGRISERVIPGVLPRSILVLAPHPDDELLSCGGTILKYAQRGTEVVVLVVTSGRGGTSHVRESPEVEEVRRKEFEVCKRKLGLSDSSEFLGIDEPLIRRANVELFTRRIRELQPDLVFFPHPEDRHRTHREVSLLAMEALFHSPTQAYAGAGKEWLPYGAYYYETLSGVFGSQIVAESYIVSDITEQYEAKTGIMREAYSSQRRLLRTYMPWIRRMAEFRGAAGRCRYGEAFMPETGHVPLKILVV